MLKKRLDMWKLDNITTSPYLRYDKSLWSSQWCLIRTHHNYPILYYPITYTRPDTRLPQSRAGGYLRSLDNLGRSSEAKDRKKTKKVKCDERTDRPTDGRTGVELRSTRLIIGKKVEVSLWLFDIFERNMVFIFLLGSWGSQPPVRALQWNW